MNRPAATHGISGLLVCAAIGAWLLTGQEGYTRWPDAKLAQSDAMPSQIENDLFADIGFESSSTEHEQPSIESRFAFGLVPGGLDAKHLPSLATVAAGAFAMSSFVCITSWRSKSRRKNTIPSQHEPEHTV